MKTPIERIITALILLIFVFLLFSVIVFSTEKISTSARSAVLYEPSEKGFIYKKNSLARLPMASTTKIMTAIVVSEICDPEESVTIPKEACGIEGSSLYLTPGEVLSVKDLLYALMLRSANDAAVALALYTCGGIEEFSSLMNKKARDFGLSNTSFKNPHGLDDPEHYTTAEDLAVIAAHALSVPLLKKVCSQTKYTITNKDGLSRTVVNHNKLLRLYEGAIGVKTGFTKKSGRCLVGACERQGLTFVTVTIDAPDDWNDHIKLFDLGYSIYEMRTPAIAGQFSYKIPVLDQEVREITVTNKDELKLLCRRDDAPIIPEVRMQRMLASPISKKDTVGKVIFTMNGVTVGEIALYPQEDVNLSKRKGIFHIFGN